MSEIDDQIKEMAKLALFSNRISEIHEKNLGLYPFIFFDGIKTVKIKYDLARVDDVELDTLHNLTINKPSSKSYVKYILTMDESVSNSHLEQRFLALEKAVRDIFWKNIVVEVVFNDRTVYKSNTNV